MSLVMRSCRSLLVAVLLIFGLAVAHTAEAPAPQFKKGDTVAVIGDSITHGGRYHSFIYLFYATRFPDREIRVYNCGISGDSAAGACRRFEWDIAVHKPTAATVLLGMNDVGRNLYGKDKTDAKSRKAQADTLAGYAANMTKLAEFLKKAKVRTTFLTPTVYEQNADTGTENFSGCNDGLANCGKEGAKIARKFHYSVIDLHALMNEVNEKGQKEDPKFTIVGKDRVHPGDVGHFVMAYAILKAQKAPEYVSKMAVNAETGKAEEENCKISDLKAAREEVSFTCLENALPFPVPDTAKDALKLVPFEKEMNQEVLKVDGLAAGTYGLQIDGEPVGEYTAGDLKAGVNLAADTNTPQYKQALDVAGLNAKRQSLESGRLRSLACVQHGMLANKVKVDLNDIEAVTKALNESLEKLKSTPYYAFNKAMVDNYLKYKPEEKQTIQDVEQAMTSMYEVNKPTPHNFVIKKK